MNGTEPAVKELPIQDIIDVDYSNIEIDKTICNATSDRQEETKELSKQVDKMIIVGGKHSSNTKELEKSSLFKSFAS